MTRSPSGLLISFEGPEGAGKSVQARALVARLNSLNLPVRSLREPGGTPLGSAVRELVLGSDLEMTPWAEFLLFSASRAQLVEEVIVPSLENDEIVVIDRFFDSSLAYQGFGRGLDLVALRELSLKVTRGIVPALTVLLDLDPAEGLRRAAARDRLDRVERADRAFHERVRAGFLELARAEPERFLVLDATRGKDELAREIWLAAEQLLAS